MALPKLRGPAAMINWGEVELPGFDAPLAAVAPARREALAVHLRELIADLKARARTIVVPALPDDDPRVATGCGLCRGYCCSTGGDTAYLNPRTIVRFWSEHPELSGDAVVAAYLDAVPDRALAGSCVFHTAHGCNLPRAMRSNVCMTYQCTPLRNALSADTGEDRATGE